MGADGKMKSKKEMEGLNKVNLVNLHNMDSWNQKYFRFWRRSRPRRRQKWYKRLLRKWRPSARPREKTWTGGDTRSTMLTILKLKTTFSQEKCKNSVLKFKLYPYHQWHSPNFLESFSFAFELDCDKDLPQYKETSAKRKVVRKVFWKDWLQSL